MSRATRQIVGLLAMLALVVPMTCFGPNFFLNAHTHHCPVSHQFAAGSACFVLDRSGSRVLVQHANLDTASGYLEIVDGAETDHFGLPQGMETLSPMDYTVRLIPGAKTAVRLDGQRVELESW
ncbi:hypothetical protein MK489_02410 [Myxococcota bacterium]|nr:hypothetical protein [Myxococcota bacterium]